MIKIPFYNLPLVFAGTALAAIGVIIPNLPAPASAAPAPAPAGQSCPAQHPARATWHKIGATRNAWSYVPRDLAVIERREGHPVGPCGIEFATPRVTLVINSRGQTVDVS